MSDLERVVDHLDKLTERLGEVVTELKLVSKQQINHQTDIVDLRRELKAEQEARRELERKVDRWVNRGWGAWGVVVAIFTVVTALNWPQQLMGPPTDATKRPTLLQSTSGRQ